MIIYQVTNYSDLNEWFSRRKDACDRFDDLLGGDYEGDQESLRTLEVVKCISAETPAQVLLKVLSGNGWADSTETIREVAK